MRLLLFIFFLFPFCAMAQIEVVNESMICDSNSNVLEIGKFNYLRFKNLPDSAAVSVSKGILKPDAKRKNVFYIPGAKQMEGQLTDLSATHNGKIIFSKSYRFRKIERYIDPIDTNYSGFPFKFGQRKIGKYRSFTMTVKEFLEDPAFYPLLSGISIESFEFTILKKRQDVIGPIKVLGAKILDKEIKYIDKYTKIFIEKIAARYSDGTCFDLGSIIITIKEESNAPSDKAKVK